MNSSIAYHWRIVVSLVIATALMMAPATAQSGQPDWADSLYESSLPMVETFNAHVGTVDLGVAGDQLAGERVHLEIESDQGTATFSFLLTDDLEIAAFQQGAHPDATISMKTTLTVYERIVASPTPAVAFVDAVSAGEISISGIGVVNSVKWTVINVVADLARLFDLI
jgi:hypothetical protein